MGTLRDDIDAVTAVIDDLEVELTEDITDIRDELRQLRAWVLTLEEEIGGLKKENKDLRDKLTFMQVVPQVHYHYPPQVIYQYQPPYSYTPYTSISSGSYSV